MASIKTFIISVAVCGAMVLPMLGVANPQVPPKYIATQLVPIIVLAGCTYSVSQNTTAICRISPELNGIIRKMNLSADDIQDALSGLAQSKHPQGQHTDRGQGSNHPPGDE